MKALLRQRATYDDLVKVPENMIAELIDGDLYTSPRPAGPHARFSSALGMDIGTPYDRGRGGPGGWWIIFEPELHLGEQVVVPDLAGWRRERMPRIPKDQRFIVTPDWLCEVISPSTARIDRGKKMDIYAGTPCPGSGSSTPSHGFSKCSRSKASDGAGFTPTVATTWSAPIRSRRRRSTSLRSGARTRSRPPGSEI
jgi:hypothetical protein